MALEPVWLHPADVRSLQDAVQRAERYYLLNSHLIWWFFSETEDWKL